jgi:hypothetical protein
MSKDEFDGAPESDWEDRGDVAWNEFDWERYLRAQDETVNRYLAYYETFRNHPQRIDEVARHMDWENGDEAPASTGSTEEDADEHAEDFGADSDVYTLHKNPIFIATRALYLRLRRNWELVAGQPGKVSQTLAVSYLSALQHGEDQAVQAIHALEFGDFAMAISLFKRALSALNASLALLNDPIARRQSTVEAYRAEALTTLFDLREIWLRVISECRAELQRPVEDEES